jgi:hypothetical protein
MAAVEGLPEGLTIVRWGKPDPASGEYLFLSGTLTTAYHGDALVVTAAPGYTISLNHYTNQYSVSSTLPEPQVLYVKVTLQSTLHQQIWQEVNRIAQAEQIPVEILPAPPA